MGNGGSRGYAICRGNDEPKVFRLQKSVFQKAYQIDDGINKINDLTTKFKNSKNVLIDDIYQIHDYYYYKIPKRKKDNQDATDSQTKIKQAELKTATDNLNSQTELLTAAFNNLATEKQAYDGISTEVKNTNRLVQGNNAAATSSFIKSKDMLANVYNTIYMQNRSLHERINDNDIVHSADNSKTAIKNTNVEFIDNIQFIMFLFYYALVIFIIYLFIFNNLNIYSKIISIFILIIYPLSIYNIQYFIYTKFIDLWKYVQFSIPENK